MATTRKKKTQSNPPGLSRRRVLAVAAVVAGGVLLPASTGVLAQTEGNAMTDNEKIVREFIAAWSNLDAAELVEYFTEDGTYHNMMLDPVSGHEALLQFINGFLANWSETDWELLNIVSQGDLVLAERIDRTRIGEIRVDLPCVGVFEMQDGKIKVWRDYFDLATYTGAFSG